MKVGQLITRVGILLAKACDLFLETKRVPSRMEDILKGSMCSKGRLLHYFPTAGSSKSTNKWCGTHCDHGTLTGMYIHTRRPTELNSDACFSRALRGNVP